MLWNDGVGTSALLNFLDGGTRRLSAYAPSMLDPIGGRTIAAVAVVAACWALVSAWLIRATPGAEHAHT